MGHVTRSLYLSLNVAFGASIGAAASLLLLQQGAWIGRPSPELLGVGAVVIFGFAYVATVTSRGQRPTVRGLAAIAVSAGAVVGAATLAVRAPHVAAWVAVLVTAASVGVVAGLALKRG